MFHLIKTLPKLVRPSFSVALKATKRLPMRAITYSFSTLHNNNPNNLSEMDKLKQDSKAFYTNQVQRIHEFKNISQWQTLIQQANQPVVIDLYADWCGPCKQLTPILEKQAEKDGNWKLVKINIDKFPQIAAELNVKTVPMVLLLANRQFVDAFSGLPDDITFKRFLDNLKKCLDTEFLDNTKKQNQKMMKVEKAREFLINRDYAAAEKLLEEVLPDLVVSLQVISKLMYAHALVEQNKFTKYQEVVKAFRADFGEFLKQDNPKSQQFEFAKDYLRELDVIYQDKKTLPLENEAIVNLKTIVDSDPTNLQAKFDLANEYINNDMPQDGLAMLLDIVKANRNWEGKKANNLILEVFKKLGNSSDVTIKYRKLYQRLLY